MINLIPTESSSSEGLAFNLYALRVAERFGLSKEELLDLLPDGTEPWPYQDAGPEWEGFKAHFQQASGVEPLLEAIDSSAAMRRDHNAPLRPARISTRPSVRLRRYFSVLLPLTYG